MNIFEILGPVMVGPSSSHTAGAVRIGYISRQLLGEPVKDATLGLYGSFWLTGSGHGTPLARSPGCAVCTRTTPGSPGLLPLPRLEACAFGWSRPS